MNAMNALVTRQREPGLPTQLIRRFVADQNGSLTIFALVLFVLMVFMGGLAIDLMRYEQTRTALQNTLDRATLASASLTQTLNPADVVTDYFTKAGMVQYLNSVTVTEGLNFRNVVADASAATNPFFLNMLQDGKITADRDTKYAVNKMDSRKQLDAVGHSMAEQRISNVEITLVLDVSGSMGSNNRLVNLKSAAKEFVSSILTKDVESKIAIAIVPFNSQVNVNADLLSKYTNRSNASGTANVNCIDLPAAMYNQTSIPTNTPLSMSAHADGWTISLNYYDYHYDYYSATDANWAKPYVVSGHFINNSCPPEPQNMIALPSRSITTLQSQINNLYAIGGTSIDTGFKWGLAMMDPTLRSAYSSLISGGKIPSSLSGRPFDYTDPEAMKVIVVMTDGENTSRDQVGENYKSGLSSIYKSSYDGQYSIRFQTGRPGVAGSNEYYVPHKNAWQNKPYTRDGSTSYTATQQTWPQVWSAMRVKYVAWQFYARALSGGDYNQMPGIFDTWMSTLATSFDGTTMDTQLNNLCTMAKTNKVIVYGIAFEAPPVGQTAISKCATSSAHYFNASGIQISTAFRAIASNISQLRLTQ